MIGFDSNGRPRFQLEWQFLQRFPRNGVRPHYKVVDDDVLAQLSPAVSLPALARLLQLGLADSH
jgi:hypothetical protein